MGESTGANDRGKRWVSVASQLVEDVRIPTTKWGSRCRYVTGAVQVYAKTETLSLGQKIHLIAGSMKFFSIFNGCLEVLNVQPWEDRILWLNGWRCGASAGAFSQWHSRINGLGTLHPTCSHGASWPIVECPRPYRERHI